MKRLISLAIVLVSALAATAQSNGLNTIFDIEFGEFKSNVATKETNGNDVAIAVVNAVLTKRPSSSETANPERVQEVIEGVKGCLHGVRRFTFGGGAPEMKRVISGSVNNITTTRRVATETFKKKDGTIRKREYDIYKTMIDVALVFTNPENGKSTSYSYSASGEATYDATPGKSFSYALDNLRAKIISDFNNMLPIRCNILEQTRLKKDKLKEVCVDVGSAIGVEYDLSFFVYEVGEYAGKETKKKIGRIKIEEVLGDDISRCKVKSGADEIKEILDNGGKNLLIESTEQKFSLL